MNPLLFTKGARDCSKASLLELEQWQSLEKVNCSCAVDANGVSARPVRSGRLTSGAKGALAP